MGVLEMLVLGLVTNLRGDRLVGNYKMCMYGFKNAIIVHIQKRDLNCCYFKLYTSSQGKHDNGMG